MSFPALRASDAIGNPEQSQHGWSFSGARKTNKDIKISLCQYLARAGISLCFATP
jgi:hypothetical protein